MKITDHIYTLETPNKRCIISIVVKAEVKSTIKAFTLRICEVYTQFNN